MHPSLCENYSHLPTKVPLGLCTGSYECLLQGMQSHLHVRKQAHQASSSCQPYGKRQVWSSSGIQTKFNQGLNTEYSGRSEVNYSTSLLVFLEFFICIPHADEELPFCITISGKSKLSWKAASSHRQKQDKNQADEHFNPMKQEYQHSWVSYLTQSCRQMQILES